MPSHILIYLLSPNGSLSPNICLNSSNSKFLWKCEVCCWLSPASPYLSYFSLFSASLSTLYALLTAMWQSHESGDDHMIPLKASSALGALFLSGCSFMASWKALIKYFFKTYMSPFYTASLCHFLWLPYLPLKCRNNPCILKFY